MNEPDVTVTRGVDGAVVVYIDTDFEPDGSDGSQGMRVWLNEHIVYSQGE